MRARRAPLAQAGALVATLVVAGALAAPALAQALMPAAAGPASSPAPASAYDRPGVTHDEQCVGTLGDAPVIVRDAEGEQLRSSSGPVSEPPEQRETCAEAPGVRLEGIESVRAGGERMFYSWPLAGGAQAAGFIAADELASAPALAAAAAAGNGVPAPDAPGAPLYEVRPEDIAPVQRYAGPSTDRWYTYSVYGRPLAAARFALMSWSWIDVAGGGIARAAVSAGAPFHPSNVQPIALASTAGEGEPPNGTVTVAYGYVLSGEERLYGWMVTAHTFDGVCFDHMAYAGGGSPLPGTLCPEGVLTDSIGDGVGLGAGALAAP